MEEAFCSEDRAAVCGLKPRGSRVVMQWTRPLYGPALRSLNDGKTSETIQLQEASPVQHHISVLRIDIAKRIAPAIGMNAQGQIVLRKRLACKALVPCIATRPPVLIGRALQELSFGILPGCHLGPSPPPPAGPGYPAHNRRTRATPSPGECSWRMAQPWYLAGSSLHDDGFPIVV
jgi:hypothetical protein